MGSTATINFQVDYANSIRAGSVTQDLLLADILNFAGVDRGKSKAQAPHHDKETNQLNSSTLHIQVLNSNGNPALFAKIEDYIKNFPGTFGNPLPVPPQLSLGDLNATAGITYTPTLGYVSTHKYHSFEVGPENPFFVYGRLAGTAGGNVYTDLSSFFPLPAVLTVQTNVEFGVGAGDFVVPAGTGILKIQKGAMTPLDIKFNNQLTIPEPVAGFVGVFTKVEYWMAEDGALYLKSVQFPDAAGPGVQGTPIGSPVTEPTGIINWEDSVALGPQ